MTEKKYNSDSCIVLMIINFFIVIIVIGGPVSGVANPNFGEKMFDFKQTAALLFGKPLLKAQND